MEYNKAIAKNGCQGCVAEYDSDLCVELPMCSASNNNGISVIFVEADKTNETKANNK